MDSYFQPYPLGDSITGSPHSVCVSLPTMEDVIGYEEKNPRVLTALKSGYPRFFENPFVSKLKKILIEKSLLFSIKDPLLPSEREAQDLIDFIGEHTLKPIKVSRLHSVHLKNNPLLEKKAWSFLQHTGCSITSRQAEDELIHLQVLDSRYEENCEPLDYKSAYEKVQQILHDLNGTLNLSDNVICQGGMNAFYCAFRAAQKIQSANDRTLWIQLGWLYVDTIRILENWANKDCDLIQILNVTNLTELKDVLKTEGHRVAGIVTEIPTNPLVESPDIETLYELTNRYNAMLFLDPTLVSPQNIHVLEYCDIQITSLTKYAANEGDVMIGSISLNPDSKFYSKLSQEITTYQTPPYLRDLQRLLPQLENYESVVEIINYNTKEVAQFLESHPGIDKVYWAEHDNSQYNYNWLRHRLSGVGGIVTFTIKHNMPRFYDKTNFVKSPSFGTRFSMLCPFMYLAHYKEIKTPKQAKQLHELKLNPELIRFSVGAEPIRDIINELRRSLT